MVGFIYIKYEMEGVKFDGVYRKMVELFIHLLKNYTKQNECLGKRIASMVSIVDSLKSCN